MFSYSDIPDIYDYQINVRCYFDGSKYHFEPYEVIKDQCFEKAIEKDMLFIKFANFDFYEFNILMDNYIHDCIFNISENKKKDILQLKNKIEEIPFIFGKHTLFFILNEIIIHFTYSCGKTIKKKKYIKILRKIIFDIHNYFLLNFGISILSITESDIANENATLSRHSMLKDAIKDCIEYGLSIRESIGAYGAWRTYKNIEDVRNDCLSIFLECEKQKARKLKNNEERNYQYEITIKEKIGLWKNIIKEYNKLYESYLIDDVISLITFILKTSLDNKNLACCILCSSFYIKKSNNQLYCCNLCKSPDPFPSMQKQIRIKIDCSIQNTQYRDLLNELQHQQNRLINREINFIQYYDAIEYVSKQYGWKTVSNMFPEGKSIRKRGAIPSFQCAIIPPELLLPQILHMLKKGNDKHTIKEELKDSFGCRFSPETILRIINYVIDTTNNWTKQPLQKLYALLFVDSFSVPIGPKKKTVNHTAYIISGYDMNGTQDIIGIWLEEKYFWKQIFNKIRERGVQDILFVSMNGMIPGLEEGIKSIFNDAIIQHSSISTVINNSLKYVPKNKHKQYKTQFKKTYMPSHINSIEDSIEIFIKKWKNYPEAINICKKNWSDTKQLFKYGSAIGRILFFSNATTNIHSFFHINIARKKFPTIESARTALITYAFELHTSHNIFSISNWATIRSQIIMEDSIYLRILISEDF